MDEEPRYDVFLSHSSTDKPAVEELARRLADEVGLRPFLDKWHLIPGEPWQEALEEALEQSATVAVFVGLSGVSPWHNEEMRTALDNAVRTRDEYRVIPVLLPGASPESVTGFLARRTWVDFRPGLDDAEAFQRLVAGIKGEAVDIGAFQLPDEPAPYRGLLPFKAEHAEFFFGREADTQRLIEKLGQGTFVAVIGASGSGKSSLLRAGLLPALAKGALPDSSQWHTLVLTPGSQPLRALAEGLASFVPPADRLRVADELEDRLGARVDGLRTAATTLLADSQQPLLLVIDQFEEVFTLCQGVLERCRAKAEQFIANLANVARSGDRRILTVITLRADFLDRCLAFSQLKDLLQDRQMLLGPLDEPALRDAVVRPAQAVGAYFEKGLVGTILRDVGAQPGALPLLQHALYELWRARRGPWLTLDAYEASGGVSGALQRRAQATYDTLTPEQQGIARNIFVRLTALGEGISDTRRRVSMSELYPAGVDSGQVDAVLQALSGPQARLIIADEQTVEVAHEALIQQWGTLREWLEEDRAGLRIHRKLTETANEWERNGREGSYLYQGVRLGEAEEWAEAHAVDLNWLEREFLKASVQAREAGRIAVRRRMQRVIVGLVVGLVIISALAIFAVGRSQLAEQRRLAAENAEATAQAESIRAINAESTAVAEATRALNAEATADAQRVEAEQARADAEAKRLEAEQAQAEAEERRLEMERQSRIARSGELAALTLSHLDDQLGFSFLLGVEALRVLDTYRTRDNLLTVLQASPRLNQFLFGHSLSVEGVAFSPDSKTLASGSADETIILWDVVSRQPIGQPLTGHTATVTSVAFSPDGKTLASGSADETVILWDVASRRPIGQPLTGHAATVTSVTFSPDGKSLASGSADKTVILWDVASRRPIGQPLIRHSDTVSSVAFSPDGKTLASGSADETVILWDVASRQPIGQPLTGYSAPIQSLTFSPDGKTLAFSNWNDDIILWDIASRQPSGQFLTGHSGPFFGWSLAFSPDGKTLASGGCGRRDFVAIVITCAQGEMRLWDVASRQPIGQPLTGHTAAVTSVAFSPDGKSLASGSDDTSVILWDVSILSEVEGSDTGVAGRPPIGQPLTGHSAAVTSVAFSPDGKSLASGSDDTSVILWDVARRRPIGQPLTGHTAAVTSVAFSPDSKTLASGSADETVILWDVASRQPIGQPLTGHTANVTSVAFSPDGKTLASGSGDNSVILWDVASRQPIGQPLTGHSWQVKSVTFSRDGETLASGSGDGTIILWKVASRQPIVQLLISGNYTFVSSVFSVAFSPDGKTLAFSNLEEAIILWKVANRQPIGQPLIRHSDTVSSVAFSPDGKTLASGSADKTVILWDVASRQPIGQPLTGHTANVTSAAFSPDGKTLASGSDDTSIILWDVDPQSWLVRTCRIVGRNFTRQEWDTYFPDEPYRKTCEQWSEGK